MCSVQFSSLGFCCFSLFMELLRKCSWNPSFHIYIWKLIYITYIWYIYIYQRFWYLSHCCDQIPDRNNLRSQEFILAHAVSMGYLPGGERCRVCYTKSQEAEGGACCFSALSLFVIQSGTPFMVPPHLDWAFCPQFPVLKRTETHLEVCFHGDSKSSHIDQDVDNNDQHRPSLKVML